MLSDILIKETKFIEEIPEFFEGPEKLLEIWFAESCDLNVDKKLTKETFQSLRGLRLVPRERWDEILKLVKCTVLSVSSNEHCDAYVLSESSLFVWSHKMILKTCGTTALLLALPAILELAREYGLTIIVDLFYSRRNFFFQQRQPSPHSSFDDEAKFLNQYVDGSAYVLGKTNCGDHWYLYLTDLGFIVNNSTIPPTTLKLSTLPPPLEPDYTFEVLMTDLDRNVMSQFHKTNKLITAKSVTESSGIGDFFPGAIIDDYLFEPCGYSMNALLGKGYLTIHITPQPQCSYVSFETNIHCDYGVLLQRVLSVFKPQNFTVTLFAGGLLPKKENFTKAVSAAFPSVISIHGAYKRTVVTRYQFENGYKLAFTHYTRKHAKLILKGKRKYESG